MKIKKRWIFIAVVLVWLIDLWVHAEYRFAHDAASIVSIQLMQRVNEKSGDPMDYVLLRRLQDDEVPAFMDGIYALDTHQGGTPPRRDYGEYIAKVTYENGDIEILGSYCIAFVRSGKKPNGVGSYYFTDEAAFLALIQQYTDGPQLPDGT